MYEFTETVRIEVPPAAVWERLCDIEGWWVASNPEHMCLERLDGRGIEPGARIVSANESPKSPARRWARSPGWSRCRQPPGKHHEPATAGAGSPSPSAKGSPGASNPTARMPPC